MRSQPSTFPSPYHGPHQAIMGKARPDSLEAFWWQLWKEGSWRHRSCEASQAQTRSIAPLRLTHEMSETLSCQGSGTKDKPTCWGDWYVKPLADPSALRPTIKARCLGPQATATHPHLGSNPVPPRGLMNSLADWTISGQPQHPLGRPQMAGQMADGVPL